MQGRLLLLSFLFLAACTKTEQPASSSGATSASTASSTPSASATVVASAVPSASADTTTAVSASPSASAVAATSASGSPAAACGTKPLPDCPLQAWMKANMNPAVSASDTKALAVALDKAATFAPAGFSNWASIAKDGAAAAKKDDLQAAKQACKGCHDQYKDKFKKDVALRSKKI